MKVVIANDTSGECHTGCNAVMQSFTDLCAKHGMQIIARWTRKDIIKAGIAPPALTADLVIINGEGTLHHKTRNTRFFPLLLESMPYCARAVLVNAVWDTVQFMDAEHIRLMNERIMLTAVRETASAKQVAKFYHGEVLVVPDLCFAQPIRKLKRKREGTGYSDCVVSKHTRQYKGHPNFRPLIRKPTPYTWDEYTGWLQGLHHYVTGRFHGICMAIMTDTPFTALHSNTHKNEAIQADLATHVYYKDYVQDARTKIDALWERLSG